MNGESSAQFLGEQCFGVLLDSQLARSVYMDWGTSVYVEGRTPEPKEMKGEPEREKENEERKREGGEDG